LIVAIGSVLAEAPADRLTGEDRQLFAWFDQLGVEDFIHADLVRVHVENAVATAGGEPATWQDEMRAFLLSEKEGRFRFLLSDLSIAVLQRHGSDPQEPGYVGWRTASVDAEAKSILDALAAQEEKQNPPYLDGHRADADLLALRAQAFVLARFCTAHGREDVAARLTRAARRLIRKGDKSLSYERGLKQDLGGALLHVSTLDLANPALDRRTLAARFQRLADHLTDPEQAEAATKAAQLRALAEDDDRHRPPGAAEFARLSPADRARELVWQLRDEYHPYDFDGWPRPWPCARPQGNGSFDKLRALGVAAAPALLEAMNDERPSRTIRCWGGPMLGIQSIPICQLAVQALDQIAGVEFEMIAGPGVRGWPDIRRVAGQWWRTTQEHGEVEWYRAQLAGGEANAAFACLEAMAHRHPELLPEMLPEMIPHTGDPRLRRAMMGALDGVNTPEINAFLQEQMDTDPTCLGRMAAALILQRHQQPEALAAMLAELARQKPDLLHWKPSRREGANLCGLAQGLFFTPDSPDDPLHVVNALLSCDSTLAIQEIAALLPRCPADLQQIIIGECAQLLQQAGMGPLGAAKKETRRAMEALFIEALAGAPADFGPPFSAETKPAIAEIAASALTEIWPEKYHYDATGSTADRAAQIAAILASYRKTAGQSAGPRQGQ
jgi:hypothetical protein